MVRKSEMRRERITVRRGTDADLKIVNGLDADINQFWLADRNGTLYSATDVPAGVEAALTPFEKESIGGSDEILLFELRYPQMVKELDKESMPEILRDEMESHGILLSDDVTVSVQQDGQQWRITDQLLRRSYNIKTNIKTGKPEGLFEIYGDRQTSLRGIFASENWIKKYRRSQNQPSEISPSRLLYRYLERLSVY